MKQILLICAVVALVGCGENRAISDWKEGQKARAKAAAESPTVEIADPIVEKAIREQLEKPEGELTKADLEKVTELNLRTKDLTELPKGLEKLTHLTHLYLEDNPDLTFAQIDELKKALPKCRIHW